MTQWAFYTAKRKYMAEEKSSTCGEFLQLSAGSELVPSPLKKLCSDGRDRSGRMLKSASNLLNIELKTKQSHIDDETACRFAQGFVEGLLSQGQMAGLCTKTYSPSRLTFYFLECKGGCCCCNCKRRCITKFSFP